MITLDEEIPDVRPGFSCTAEITTSTRRNVVSVPIQAVTVREMLHDSSGALVHEPPPPRLSRFQLFRRGQDVTAAAGLILADTKYEFGLTPEGELEIKRNQVLPDKVGPEDVAPMALFLASDDSRACSAQEYIVDAGWL